MELVAFTAAGIVAWVLADLLLDQAEQMAGRRFAYRSVFFFGLLLGLLLAIFEVSKLLFGTGG
jgi:hypothetical protein